MMRQLTSLDAQFLALEDGRNHAHVSSLAIHDPSTAPGGVLTLDAIRATIEERLHLLPPFRWRLAEVPLGIDYPYWVDSTDFDLDFHLRELALPSPGDDRMLAEQVARIVSRPLDRNYPLWELYLIHGLQDGRVAVLTKFHHAAVDGASGGEALSVLLDPSPHGREIAPRPDGGRDGEAMPSQLALLGRGIAGVPAQPLRMLRTLPRILPHLDQVPTMRHMPGTGTVASVSRRIVNARPRLRTRDGGVLEGRNVHAPRTMLNGPISPHRRLALTRQSLDEIKRIKNHYGVTVNDVVVAICAGALRDWLLDLGELPDAPLTAMIPVSVRTAEQTGTYGNRVSTMLVEIPTDEADAQRRLLRAHEILRAAKEHHSALPVTVMQDANQIVPPALMARAARVTTLVAARHPTEAPVNTVISNVPGWREPQYLAGARLEALYPVSAIMDGIGLNLTVMSDADGLNFGVVADRELVDDPWPLAEALSRAQAELLALVDRAAVPAAPAVAFADEA
jgi:diacylglycerol O-acyltransferase